jgi:hypothetical protein
MIARHSKTNSRFSRLALGLVIILIIIHDEPVVIIIINLSVIIVLIISGKDGVGEVVIIGFVLWGIRIHTIGIKVAYRRCCSMHIST